VSTTQATDAVLAALDGPAVVERLASDDGGAPARR
jgi:hypothetical protein